MYTMLVTGDVPGASTYFNPLLQQTIIPCTSGTHPSSPPDGMLVWETDTECYATWNATLGAWVILGRIVTATYTPSLTASTNPTLGTGGLAEGRYTLYSGKWCSVRGTIKFGTSGTNAGSGAYQISLPFTSSSQIANGFSSSGCGLIRSGGAQSTVTYYIQAGNATMPALTPAGTNVGSAVPGAWGTSGDYLSFSITYEIA